MFACLHTGHKLAIGHVVRNAHCRSIFVNVLRAVFLDAPVDFAISTRLSCGFWSTTRSVSALSCPVERHDRPLCSLSKLPLRKRVNHFLTLELATELGLCVSQIFSRIWSAIGPFRKQNFKKYLRYYVQINISEAFPFEKYEKSAKSNRARSHWKAARTLYEYEQQPLFHPYIFLPKFCL